MVIGAASSPRVRIGTARHPSWFTAAADRLLGRHRVARVAANPSRAAGADVPGGFATDIWVVFDNTAMGSAVDNAWEFQALLSAPAPSVD